MASQRPSSRAGSKAGANGFAAIAEVPSIFAARKGKLSMFAVPLRNGGICLVSPVKGLLESTRESLLALGPVRFLFAPNHYHNLGLPTFSAAFPDAKLIAPQAAIPRLQEVTGLTFADPHELASAFPDNISLLETEGLKTGENWIRIQSNGSTAWIVTDAFCGPDVNGGTDGPDLLKPFPKFGLGDKDIYLPWLERRLQEDRPDTLIPCHGRAVQCAKLCEQIRSLVNARLGS